MMRVLYNATILCLTAALSVNSETPTRVSHYIV